MEDDNDNYTRLPSLNYSCWRPLRCNGQCQKLTSLQGRTCGKDTDKNDRKHFYHNHDYLDVMKNIVLIIIEPCAIGHPRGLCRPCVDLRGEARLPRCAQAGVQAMAGNSHIES